MKLICLCLSLFFAAQIAQAQKDFTISGTFKNKQKQGKLLFMYKQDGEYITDTLEVKNGKFSRTVKIDEPGAISNLSSLPYPRVRSKIDMRRVYTAPGKMEFEITDSLKYARIKGSKENELFLKLVKQMEPVTTAITNNTNELIAAMKDENKEKADQLQEKEVTLKKQQEDMYLAFMKSNPSSPITYALLEQRATGLTIDVVPIADIWDALDAKFKNTPGAKAMGLRIETARKTLPGQPAIEFTQNNVDGQPVKLADFRGKYVLIDFWASWCGPCRGQNPNLLKHYEKYKDRNFTILGVSLDDDHADWAKAVKDDRLPWVQLCDLKGPRNEVAVQYGINFIPQSILIGPDGAIVAKHVNADELAQTLKKVFGE